MLSMCAHDHLATGGQPEDRSNTRWNAEPTTVIGAHAAEFVLAEFPEPASKAAL